MCFWKSFRNKNESLRNFRKRCDKVYNKASKNNAPQAESANSSPVYVAIFLVLLVSSIIFIRKKIRDRRMAKLSADNVELLGTNPKEHRSTCYIVQSEEILKN